MADQIYQPLSEIKEKKDCVLMGVAKDAAIFLQVLTKLNLNLGVKITIVEINSFDRSLQIQVNGAAPIFVSHEVAKNILVKA